MIGLRVRFAGASASFLRTICFSGSATTSGPFSAEENSFRASEAMFVLFGRASREPPLRPGERRSAVLSTTLVANGIDGHLCRTALQRIHWTTSTPRGMSISALKPFMAGIAIRSEHASLPGANGVLSLTQTRLISRHPFACRTGETGHSATPRTLVHVGAPVLVVLYKGWK
jgi:hypothetical protein